MKTLLVTLLGVFAPLFAVAYVYAFLWLLKKIDKL